MLKYHLITYGCQMNKSDSERIAAGLERRGYKSASSVKEADLIVINMCSVRQSAVDRVFGVNQKFLKSKFQNPKLKIVLTGCILKKDGRKFEKMFDEIWGNKNYFKAMPECKKNSLAYVPVSNGCNNFCAYCVVPLARGRLVCRSHQEIMKEIRRRLKTGAKEIWLLGQNVNDYRSPAEPSVNFAQLLKKVCDLPGNFSVRFMSPHPKNFTNELIETMAHSPKIAKYLNLPLQSGDDIILKKMKRNYTAKQYKCLVKKIREKMPEINLSTDVIVGFPGETAEQFENTVKLFKETKFDIAYVAKYSPRAGTAAFLMKDDVPQEEKKRRAKILNKLTKHGR